MFCDLKFYISLSSDGNNAEVEIEIMVVNIFFEAEILRNRDVGFTEGISLQEYVGHFSVCGRRMEGELDKDADSYKIWAWVGGNDRTYNCWFLFFPRM